jgi:hypothetical protein
LYFFSNPKELKASSFYYINGACIRVLNESEESEEKYAICIENKYEKCYLAFESKEEL